MTPPQIIETTGEEVPATALAATPLARPAPELLFRHPRAAVFRGRWEDLCLPPRSVDVVLTDPPYTSHVHANVRSVDTSCKIRVRKYEVKFAPVSDYRHVMGLLTLARRWVLCFCALEQFDHYRQAAGGDWSNRGQYVRSGIWRKRQAAPQITGDRPANSCEGYALMHARWAGGERLRWNGGGKHAYHTSAEEDCPIMKTGRRGVTRMIGGVPAFVEEDGTSEDELLAFLDLETAGVPDFISENRETKRKRHPAQKPRALCDKLAEWFVDAPKAGAAPPIVLDAYAGSGALGIAALRRGATVIFCDSDEGCEPGQSWAAECAANVAEALAGMPAELPEGTKNE